jgi:hypothetical protein
MNPDTVLSQTSKHLNRDVVTVQAPISEMSAGFAHWIHLHPKTNTAPPNAAALLKGYSETDSESLVIRMPSLDLYSPSGVSIYHGENSEKNAEFIRSFVPSDPLRNTGKTTDARPTLQEALSIFPELQTYEAKILAQKEYTFFAMTYPNQPMCKAQNDAIEHLKSLASHMHFRIVEVQVQLHK